MDMKGDRVERKIRDTPVYGGEGYGRIFTKGGASKGSKKIPSSLKREKLGDTVKYFVM